MEDLKSAIDELAARAYKIAFRAEQAGRRDIAETARWVIGYLERILDAAQRWGWSTEIAESLDAAERILSLLSTRLL